MEELGIGKEASALRDIATPVPPRLARRPQYKGFPIPANVVVDAETQVPDFATINESEHLRLLKERRCSLCGEALNSWFAIVGGDACYQNHIFRDGPGHLECMEFALRVCPFLARPEHGYRAGVKQHLGMDSMVANFVSENKPDIQGLFVAREYQVMRLQGSAVLRVGRYRDVSWWREGHKVG